jgi:hypothetical protein
VILFVRYFSIEYWFDEILGSVFLLLPALIVLVGSYAHVIDGKGYGRIILGFGAGDGRSGPCRIVVWWIRLCI